MANTPVVPPLPAPVAMAQPIAPQPQVMQRQKVTLLEAIAAASNAFGDLTKDSKNEYLRSQYLGLPGLLKAIKPPLLEQGVIIYTQVVPIGTWQNCVTWVVRTTVAFADGSEELSSDFPIPDPSTQQKIGAVITFGTRYNLFALLAICPENDDDGNSGTNFAAAAPAQAQALPGLPGAAPMPAAWPMPGQQVQAPQAMYQQAPAPAAMAYPVQPLPVLQ